MFFQEKSRVRGKDMEMEESAFVANLIAFRPEGTVGVTTTDLKRTLILLRESRTGRFKTLSVIVVGDRGSE